MIRNFVTGIVVGGVVAGLGLAVVSQLAPLPPGASDPEAAGEVVVVAPTPVPPAVEIEPEANPPQMAPDARETGMQPLVDAGAAAKPSADAAPAAAPVPSAEAVPSAEPVPTTAAPSADAPSTAVPAAPVPVTPTSVVPAPLPPAASAEAPFAPNMPAALDANAPQVEAGVEAAPVAAAPAILPKGAGTDAPPTKSDLPPPAPAEPAETLLTPAPAPVPAPVPAEPGMLVLDPPADVPPQTQPAAPQVPPTANEAPAPVADAAPEAAPTPLPQRLDTTQPETLAPSAGLKPVDGVTMGRLPTIGAADQPASPASPEAPAVALDAKPLTEFAAPFSNDLGKPLFAVLLVDTGAADLDRAKLAALPFAVSFVLDPLDPAATAAAAIYRAAGKEVVMLASGIPAGATAGDLEQTFQANAAALPEAVAVMDIGAQGFQDNRPLATMVVPIIKDQGRGLVTFDAGLNAADQVARREDVPAAVIFRDLDGAGEDSPLIRRYLDRAAFKAAQEGRVVVVGTTRPETIAALMEWSLEGRAASVALAPISAALAVN